MKLWPVALLSLLVGCLPFIDLGSPGPEPPPPPPPPPEPSPGPEPPPPPSPVFTGSWQEQALAAGVADTLTPTDAQWLPRADGVPWLLVTRRGDSNLLFAPAGEGFQLAAELGQDGRRIAQVGQWLIIASATQVTSWDWPSLTLVAQWPLRGPPVLALGDCSGDDQPELLAGTRLYQQQEGQWQDITPPDLALPPTLSAAAWLDLEQDGWLDLVAGTFARAGTADPPSRLWLGVGPCQFRAGEWQVAGLMSAIVTLDGNRDGWEDLYLATWGDNQLYENQQGQLVLTTGRFWNDRTPNATTSAVAVLDLEGDGWPDLYLSNDNAPDQVWRNLGGFFVEVGSISNLVTSANDGINAVAVAVVVRSGLPWLYLPSRRVPGLTAPRDQYFVPLR